MEAVEKISSELERRRLGLGLSCQQLAVRTGLSQHTIQRVMRGQCANVRVNTIAAVAKILGAEVGLIRKRTTNIIRQEQASRKAKALVKASQASAALEGQAVGKETLKQVERRIKGQLLVGPKGRLWS